jgi:hypothetical protein
LDGNLNVSAGGNGNIDNNTYIKNNIFYGMANGSLHPCAEALYVTPNSPSSAVIVSDYNLFYQVDSLTRVVDWKDNRYTTSGWNTYVATFGQDNHSVPPTDPLFVDASNRDFHLKSNSPAIGAGLNVGLLTDYDGVSYNVTNPSIGAYEYTGP